MTDVYNSGQNGVRADMITVTNLTKHFEGVTALDSAELHVPRGSIYGLVGPNGAGKTTVIRHIAGVMRPDAGMVRIDGELAYENDRVKARMLHVPDDVYFFPSAGIIEMKRFYENVYPGFDNARFEKLKEAFPLDIKKPVRRFSRGMQKQAALWLGICCRPDLILLDEPVDGLDPVMRRKVWGLIMQDVAERGTTVFVSSHNLRELEDVCDHVGIMHNGRLILERSLDELQSNIIKLQVAFEDIPPAEMEKFNILHHSAQGRVELYIIRGVQEEIMMRVAAMKPLLADALPLSLEEIFIYELGGMDYAATEIIL